MSEPISTKIHIETMKPIESADEILLMLAAGVAKVKNMTREELEEMYAAQRHSWTQQDRD